MPILLKKPFMPGDNDKNNVDGYSWAQLINLYHSGLTMAVTLEYQFGTASGDFCERWERGPGSPTRVCEISGPRVAQLWGTMPKDGESVGEAVRRAVYEYLINSGEVEGEIANNPPLPPAQIEKASPEEPAAPEEVAAAEDMTQEEAEGESAEASPAADDAAQDASSSETPAPQEGATSDASADSEQSS